MNFRGLIAILLLAAGPAKAEMFTPEGEKDFSQALVSLYNLDYEEARVYSQRLIKREPENPFSYLAESGILWWQSSNEFGLFKDTPTLENLFEKDNENIITKGQALLDSAEQKDDKQGQADGNFVIGMALGTRGEWKMLRRHWLSAYFDGKRATKHLNNCLKLDPEYYDAYIGLGLYDYMTGHLPGVLKLSTLFFIHGNAKRGLERLQIAYERAHYTPSYAAEYLASIYILDQHNDAKALPLLEYLCTRFPKSAYFQFLEIGALVRMGNPLALDKAKALAAKIQHDPAFFGRKQLSLWCGLYGEESFSHNGIQILHDWLSDAILKSGKARPSFWLDLLHFYRGVTYDILDDRASAVMDYKYVVRGPKSGAINALAQHCLENVCNKDEVIRELKAMSLQPVGIPQYIPPNKKQDRLHGTEERRSSWEENP